MARESVGVLLAGLRGPVSTRIYTPEGLLTSSMNSGYLNEHNPDVKRLSRSEVGSLRLPSTTIRRLLTREAPELDQPPSRASSFWI